MASMINVKSIWFDSLLFDSIVVFIEGFAKMVGFMFIEVVVEEVTRKSINQVQFVLPSLLVIVYIIIFIFIIVIWGQANNIIIVNIVNHLRQEPILNHIINLKAFIA